MEKFENNIWPAKSPVNGLPVLLAPLKPGARPTIKISESFLFIEGTGALNHSGNFFLFKSLNFFSLLHFEQFFFGSINIIPFFKLF